MMNCAIGLLAASFFALAVPLRSQAAVVVFHDPTAAEGDQISTVGDITSATLTFDPTTGAYMVDWTASALNPFNGNIRLNLNLGNAAFGSDIVALFDQYSALAPTTFLSYSGVNAGLLGWGVGDQIVTQGGPPTFFTSFNSGNVNLDNLSVLDRDTLNSASVISVPVPGTFALVTLALILLAVRLNRRDA